MHKLTQAQEKEIRSLLTRHGRKKSDKLMIEGMRSISALLDRGLRPERVVVSPDDLSEPGRAFVDALSRKGVPLTECSRKSMAEFSETVHSQGVIAVINRSALQADESAWRRVKLAVYLDAVADPGNVGTIIRTCAAFGVSLIILSPGSADIANPKVLRSSAGTIFALPIAVDIGAETLASYMKSNNIELVGTAADATMNIGAYSPKSKTCIALGAEATGLSEAILSLCAVKVKIPGADNVESLNVASAAAIAIYQLSQRMKLL
ncbi:MAG: RNA methyltransferase [Candidatus Zixiibacteriota bacterium]